MNLIIFSISFLIIGIFIGIKIIELRRGKPFGFSVFISKGDRKVFKIKLMLNNLSFLSRKLAFFVVFHHFPVVLHNFLARLKVGIDHKYEKLLKFLRGKRNLHHKGQVSFFLKNISDVKKEEKGRIEENNL